MIYIHSYPNQEGIVNSVENKHFFHTMENQDICYKCVLYHALLMKPALNAQLLDEDIKPDNLIMLEVWLDRVLLSIW